MYCRMSQTFLGAFNNQLIRFLEELSDTYPEEKKMFSMALEAIQGMKKVNPKLILDMFYNNVYLDFHTFIENEDENIIPVAKNKLEKEYNEASMVLIVFDKYWPAMTEHNRKAIWQYMKVLCVLCEKAKGIQKTAA